MKRWNNSSYQMINDVKFKNDNLIVSFENGDVIEIPKVSIVPYNLYDIDWKKLAFNQYEIIIPARPNSLVVPWDKIRVITDKEFAKYLAEKSEEQSKLIGVKLKRLREKNGINSKELAERAGITPQTISRIEQGHTDVSFATLRKILAAMGYSLKDLANEEIQLEMESSLKSFDILLKRLSNAGINSNLLINKIIPSKLQNALNEHKSKEPILLLDEVASYVSRIYGWTINEIWDNSNLVITPEPAALAFFKKSSNANENQIKAYSHYAYYLAKIVLKANQIKNRNDYPLCLEDFKTQYYKQYSIIDLNSLLEFVSDLGITVLPLNDTGVFHGASWNIEGKHIIVLKQNTQSHARWIFDLLHELYHVFAHLEKDNTGVIEFEEINSFSNNDSIEESEANSFANLFIFGDKAEELAEQCITLANWDIKNLTKSVLQVAKKTNIREDFLANYLSYRLSIQGENWWGSANKLQIIDPLPYILTSDHLKKNLQFQNMNPIDKNLLTMAITN